MCVSQYRDYTEAYKFKTRDIITPDDRSHLEYGTFYASQREWIYTSSEKRLIELAKNGNTYAIKQCEDDGLQFNEPEEPTQLDMWGG